MKREEVKQSDKWKIEDIYASDELWQADLDKLNELCRDYEKYKGTLTKNGESLLAFLDFNVSVSQIFEKVYMYASQKSHEDLGDGTYQNMAGKAADIEVKLSSAGAFADPEILSMTKEQVEEFIKEQPGLLIFKKGLFDLFRQKEHILDGRTEEILAKVNNVSQASSDIFSMFNNVDAKFESAKDKDGEEHSLSQANFVKLQESEDRTLRENAFKNLYKEFEEHKNTVAATFNANVKQAAFFADVRGYSSSRAMYLDDSNVPESVYDNLINTVHDRMSLMHKYVGLRKKALGVDELHFYDIYTAMVADVDMGVSFEDAKKIVKDGLKPMGEEYLSHLQEGFDNGWIDVYPNEGKRTGAYSWGPYGVHPYVMLNYQENLDNIFTLAHEMGHALHSYYSDKTQPYPMAEYKIFVAEVASTCNETLLIMDMIDKCEDKQEKIYLINNLLEHFKGTLYRQTMFAEFERDTHELSAKGEVLTADVLCDIYYELNKKYFGDNIVLDKEIAYEWARIPHFYTPFYVYQYATGFSAAIALASKIRENGEVAVADYMKFLTGGGSADPIDLLKLAGVDMSKPAPIEAALDVFEKYLGEMDELLK